jgi:hypothetical protein
MTMTKIQINRADNLRTNQKLALHDSKYRCKKKPTNVDISTFVGLSKYGPDKSRTCDPHLVEVRNSTFSFFLPLSSTSETLLYQRLMLHLLSQMRFEFKSLPVVRHTSVTRDGF